MKVASGHALFASAYSCCVYVEIERKENMFLLVFLTKFMPSPLYNKHEEGDVMYYELYVDSLFLVNFVMNLYLLLLVNRKLFRTATRKCMLLGAAAGAILYFLPFLLPGPVWLKYIIGMPPGTIAMILIAFRVRSVGSFWRILESLLLYSVLLGGAMLLIRKLPLFGQQMTGIWGILGVGALVYLLFGYCIERKNRRECLCKVTLIQKGNRVTVWALLDSGNSLIEPISGKPVAVIEKDLALKLWGEEPHLYRAIPYHSIGKKRGILKGYLLQEMQIETEGVVKICKEAYVAVCEEYITEDHIKMILNPVFLNGEEKMRIERFG